MKISVVVLIYNSELKEILLTLKSIVKQINACDVEIILADDGSQKKYENEIRYFLKKINYSNYIFAPSSENVGTVNNILRAIPFCGGKYIKPIGAGDLFFSEDALWKAYNYMEKGDYKCAFGKLKSYIIENKDVKEFPFSAPVNKRVYAYEKIERIKKNMILGNDYISGASMIYQKEFLYSELSKLSGIVKYAEDCVQIPIILSGTMIKYIPINFILYKVGRGISTSKEGNKRITQDHKRFFEYLKNNYDDSIVASLEKRDRLPRVLRMLVRWTQNPYIRYQLSLRNYQIAHFKRNKRSDELGFLSDRTFLEYEMVE